MSAQYSLPCLINKSRDKATYLITAATSLGRVENMQHCIVRHFVPAFLFDVLNSSERFLFVWISRPFIHLAWGSNRDLLFRSTGDRAVLNSKHIWSMYLWK